MLLPGIPAPSISLTESPWGRTPHKWLVIPLHYWLPSSGGRRCHVVSLCDVWDTMMTWLCHTRCNLPASSSYTQTLLFPPSPAACKISHPTQPRLNRCRPWIWSSRGWFWVPSCGYSGIVGHWKSKGEIDKDDKYYERNGRHYKKKTMEDWDMEFKWKDVSTLRLSLNNLNKDKPIGLEQYSVHHSIDLEP